jgi:hypothetical protein
MRLLTAGDGAVIHELPGLGCGHTPIPERPLLTCGVVSIDSSMSSASMRSSSELLPDDSEPIIFMLPNELDTVVRSLPRVDHSDIVLLQVDSEKPPNCPLLLFGMFIALPVIVGEESGEDCSARVEWWRFVAALEKSSPRDLRGITGEP